MKRLLLVSALLLMIGPSRVWAAACSSTAVGTFTCVQSAATNIASSATPQIATGSNVASTNVIVGEFFWVSTTITLNSLTLSGAGCSGASSALYDNPLTETAWRSAAFSLWGLSAGACTIQFNLSGAVAAGAGLHVLNGAVNNADPVGTRHNKLSQQAPGTGTDAVTTNAVTAAGTDYIFASSIDCNQTSPINAGTGYNAREGTNNGSAIGAGCYISTEDLSASGSNTATFTDTSASAYNLSHILSVAAAGGAARTPTLSLLGVSHCGEDE